MKTYNKSIIIYPREKSYTNHLLETAVYPQFINRLCAVNVSLNDFSANVTILRERFSPVISRDTGYSPPRRFFFFPERDGVKSFYLVGTFTRYRVRWRPKAGAIIRTKIDRIAYSRGIRIFGRIRIVQFPRSMRLSRDS